MFKISQESIKKNIMSVKNSNTTSDYIEWDSAINLIHKLYRDGDYRMSLLVGCGIFFGTRISDTLQITWAMLLDDDRFELIEKKTKKRREIKGKGERERCHSAESRVPENSKKRFKKAFYSEQCKEIEGKNRIGKTRDLLGLLRWC